VSFTNNTDASDLLPGSAGVGGGAAVFSNLNNGYTTVTLTFDTTGHTNTDVLMIYLESAELKVRPYDFGVDAVERMKVGTPQSLIDADFEYGMQPTKWVQFPVVNDQPMTYEQPGTDVPINIFGYATFLTGTTGGSTWINGTNQTAIKTLNQGDVNLGAAPRMPGLNVASQAGYFMVVAQGQANMPNCAAGTTYITNQIPIAPATGGTTQKTFTAYRRYPGCKRYCNHSNNSTHCRSYFGYNKRGHCH
jgi:hypothetical protein